MSIHEINAEKLLKQIDINWKENQLEWEPKRLEDNIFELVSIISDSLKVQLEGAPIRISEKPLRYAWKFQTKEQLLEKTPKPKFLTSLDQFA